ncbi:MAG: aconitate hydratase [Desulfuromonadales bacterium]
MSENLTRKILASHLVEGELKPDSEIGLRIDHTLLQDATGTMAMLEFEALGLDRVKADLAAQYVDHNLLQTDFKNADDHRYLRTACAHYGLHYSEPGNGISHIVHMERFGRPGLTMLGADSHTPGAASVSMLAFGAGGMDVALAMAGKPYYLPCPNVFGVKLINQLPKWVSAKDVILEMLRRYDVKGCVGKIIEYFGPGVVSLSATDRMTIGNMGTELGATSTVFPSDSRTLQWLTAQRREEDWLDMHADPGCSYDEYDEIDLSTLEPLVACPTSPGNIKRVKDVAGTKVDQVIVGSSVNGSYRDLMVVAGIVAGKHAAHDLSFHVNPGSRQVLENVAESGSVMPLLLSGARIHQSGCLGCIGMGQAPGTGQVSLRTFPRNFPGRSGTKDDQVYLCSPETAAASALTGVMTDPRDLDGEMAYPQVIDPEQYLVDTSSLIMPTEENLKTEIIRGPNIKPFPEFDALPETLEAEVAIKVADNISTDGIMPAGSEVLPLRSNIEAISEYVFHLVDEEFVRRVKQMNRAVVIGGDNYGQGSSREHAALAPRYLGVRAKIVKSFARIHKANLCNFGILPLTFKDQGDYERVKLNDKVVFTDIRKLIEDGATEIPVLIDSHEILTLLEVSDRQRQHLLAGGTLNYVRKELNG